MTVTGLPAHVLLSDAALAAATAALGGDRASARAALSAALPVITAEGYERAAAHCRAWNGQASHTARRFARVAAALRGARP